MNRLLLSFVFLLITSSVFGAKKLQQIKSNSTENPSRFITVDGLTDFTQLDDEKIYISVSHNADSILVVLGISEQFMQLKLLTQGVKLHFDYTGKTNTRYTVEFPIVTQDELKAMDTQIKSQNLGAENEGKLEVKQIVGRIGMEGATLYNKQEELDFSPAQTKISINSHNIVYYYCVVAKDQVGGKAGDSKSLNIGFTNELIIKADPSADMAGGLQGGIHRRGYIPQSYGNHPLFRPIKRWVSVEF